MKKIFLCALALFCANASAANLMQVFQQALVSDPTYQQAIAQRMATREGVPISIAGLLPNISATLNAPNYSRYTNSGSAAIYLADAQRQQGYVIGLNLSQTVFDFGKFAGVASARALADQANATLSAATQALMMRVSQAYFNILRDQDNLAYIKATRTAYEKQLDQVTQQYKVGIKTITDVYTARASYEGSVANYIGAESTLATDRENLRAITGVMYPTLARLSDNFPLLTPHPANIEDWVTTAGRQNWSVKSAQYAAQSSRDIIKQQFAGHLPTVNIAGSFQNMYNRIGGGDGIVQQNGTMRNNTTNANLTINVPLVAGGQVIAQTNQAKYNYEVALQQLELQLRTTLTQTRQSYLNVVAGISKIQADREAIKSNISSLEGMEAGYRVGTEILVNVLNQQQNVVQAQQQYAADRYAYVNNLLLLKQAAGTLGVDDLAALNNWLLENGNADQGSYNGYYKNMTIPVRHSHPATSQVHQKKWQAKQKKKVTTALLHKHSHHGRQLV